MSDTHLPQVYFCAGARNSDLLDHFIDYPLHFECDERSASFKALGFAKMTQSPSIVCTTSGTAVSECLSAMIEAYYSNTPLVLISGDRPKKMHHKGSPQTIDHEIITRGHRKTYIETTLDEFKKIDLKEVDYPAHINVLIEKESERNEHTTQDYSANWEGFQDFIETNSRPFFLFSHDDFHMKSLIEKFKTTKIPFYAEILSQAHLHSPIIFERDVLEAFHKGQINSIVRIGHTPLSKLWRLLEKSPIPQFSFDSRGLPALSYGTVMPFSSKDLISEDRFWKLTKNINATPIDYQADQKKLSELLKKYPHSDMGKLATLQSEIPEGSIIYLGNSLVIRFFELILNKEFVFLGNRGVNGIDGQLATAIGAATATSKTVYCILGDLTTFYDLSSIKDLPKNLKLIIVNNSGGKIFEVMGMRQEMCLNHNHSFKKIVEGMEKTYVLDDVSRLRETQVLELRSSGEETIQFLKEWES